jgi:hypothetical protein
MFGGKIMGLAPETISRIAGRSSSEILNCGGGDNKFCFVVRSRGFRCGSYTDVGLGRNRSTSTGYDLYRKPTPNDVWNSTRREFWTNLTTAQQDNSHSWNYFNSLVDVYVTIHPNRNKSYYISNTSAHPESYFINIVDSYLP